MESDNKNEKLIISQSTDSPAVVLTRIKRINTYEVMDSELDTLDQIVAEENRAIGFLSLSFGVFTSTLTPFLVSPPPDSAGKSWGIYVAVTIVSGMATLWFGAIWLSARKRRPRLLDRIRSTTTLTQTLNQATNPITQVPPSAPRT